MEPDKQLETQHTNKGLSEVFSSKREELEQLLEKKFEPALKLLTESELKTLLIAQDFRNSIAHFSIYDSTHYSNKEAKTLPKD
ncbi:MAG: hypothetical protein KDD62_06905, partial [Bdellovibrionales bacterium]|nr:hypothetical protein [Bdellovibrionales bacterium]